MNEAKMQIIEKRIQKTIANLQRHNMAGYYARTCEEAVSIALSLMTPGETVSTGGSVTLKETGMMDKLRDGTFHYLDRSVPGLTKEQIELLHRQTFSADTYLMSSNAITETGELYNVDGNSNRVAALAYGPKQVIILAGYNKIVPDLKAAVTRVEKIAAPANTTQLHSGTPCIVTGECEHCTAPLRACCNFMVTGFQRQKNRVKVILIGEELGF